MKSSLLTATAIVALLATAPGLALAESHAAATHKAAANTNYEHVGQGGYTGQVTPIANNNGNNNANNNNAKNATASNARPSRRNPVLADNGDVRIGKMIGSTVYNDQDQKLGSIDGVIAGHNGLWAVVSTNSNNNKTVAVPFKDFVFGNAQANGDDQVVLPYTQARLNAMPVFHYDQTQYANDANNGGNG